MGFCPPLCVEVGCLNCIGKGNDVRITLGDVPRKFIVCFTGSDVDITRLDVDVGCFDCIHIADIDCISDVVVTFYVLEQTYDVSLHSSRMCC